MAGFANKVGSFWWFDIECVVLTTLYVLLQEGCHVSGWCADILKQIFFPISNLPFG